MQPSPTQVETNYFISVCVKFFIGLQMIIPGGKEGTLSCLELRF